MPYRSPSPSHETRRLPMLRQLSTKTPCSTRWAEMDGDDRCRHCFRCSKKVYKLDAMTEDEAESFLALHEDGFFRRPDGTILTENCTVGIERKHRFNLAFSALIAISLLAIFYFAFHDVSFKSTEPSTTTTYQPRARARIEAPRQKSVVISSPGLLPPPEPHADGNDAQFIGYAMRPWQYEAFISMRDLSSSDPMPDSKSKINELYYVAKQSNGTLPMDVVRRMMGVNMWRLRVCFDAYLETMPPKRSGDLLFHFVIARDGSVAHAVILEHNPREFLPQTFGHCLTQAFHAISFPAPEGGVVSIDYWLDFVPPPPAS